MKKILFFAMLLSVTMCFAQKTKDKTKVYFYGVDFSDVNVVGATESESNFINAFEGINGLFITEPKKYDIAKFLNLDVLSTDCKIANEELAILKDTNFINKESEEIDIPAIIAKYPSNEHFGLVIIAKELNKPYNKGTFIAVIYDGTTHQILSSREFSGKAKGFGLRNYWAGALYSGLKKVK